METVILISRSGGSAGDDAHRGMAYYVTALPADPPQGRSGFTHPEEAMVGKAVALGQQRL